MGWVLLQNEEFMDVFRIFFNKADYTCKKIAVSNVALSDIFGVDQLFDIILFFFLEDEIFMFVEEIVCVMEFRCDVNSGDSS